jgi:hypothetical protein
MKRQKIPIFLNKMFFPIGGLFYALALGYFSRLVVDGLSPRQTLILWIAYVLVICVYLVVILLLLLGKVDIILKPLKKIKDLLEEKTLLSAGIFSFAVMMPVFLVFTDLTHGIMQNLWFRILVFLPLVLIATFFWPFTESPKYGQRFLSTVIIITFVFFVWLQARWIVDYPFSLSWSEGNRFYDYSLIFGTSLYQYDGALEAFSSSPGRYGLWGIGFLFQNLPIWFHRLWNAILWIVPPVLLGYFAGRDIQQKVTRSIFALWIGIFFSQGPIYAPILLVGILVVAFHRKALAYRVTSSIFASFYAGLSRWTWALAPGMWSVLLDVGEDHTDRTGTWYRWIWPIFLIGFAGSLPGILVNWERILQPKDSTMSLSQPLLWYRLFPNATYSPGIILGILIATGTLVILLIGLIISRNWQPNRFQLIVGTTALLGTFAVGCIISTKIGGGSNLHNFDMYFITLVMLIVIYLNQGNVFSIAWPLWLRVVFAITILIPIWNTIKQGVPYKLPSKDSVGEAINILREEITKAASEGEVLFIDQRQLLTFGYLENIDLIPEYEKKYMMDQAMAANRQYFEDFYDDLAQKRFALIVSEPHYIKIKTPSDKFGEENNSWVQFVSIPLLCYYEPYQTLKQFNIQLLVPQNNTSDCR